MKTLPGIEIFTFSSDEPNWYIVDDDVMGGVSSSKIDFSDKGIMSFSVSEPAGASMPTIWKPAKERQSVT